MRLKFIIIQLLFFYNCYGQETSTIPTSTTTTEKTPDDGSTFEASVIITSITAISTFAILFVLIPIMAYHNCKREEGHLDVTEL